MTDLDRPDQSSSAQRTAEIFAVFLKLGLSSFGGPVAHLGYFNDEFVVRRKWLSAAGYADIVALCQFLPGPASSQVGMAIGLGRSGLFGALAAWLGFTLPSAVLMIAFAYGVRETSGLEDAAWLGGLKLAALAVVAQAVALMARSLCPDLPRAAVAAVAAVLAIAVPTTLGQIGALLLGALCGWAVLKEDSRTDSASTPGTVSGRTAIAALSAFVLLLAGLPLVSGLGSEFVALFDRFYRAGALVFGGGHVVLPLLERSVVPVGWLDAETFLAGYGAAQAVPGPLFTFAGYLGAVIAGGWGGVLCLVAIFLPSFLLIVGVIPFWNGLGRYGVIRKALKGVNAAVVGLLGAAFVDPVVPSAVKDAGDAGIAIVLLILLMTGRAPSWMIVVLGAAAASARAFAQV